jgi:hypothetical protein
MGREATCPYCNAYVPLDKAEKVGNVIYCSYCKAPLKITAEPEDGKGEVIVEEDWEGE